MLRLLWLVPVPLDLSGSRDRSGGWLDTLAQHLLMTGDVEITAVFPGRDADGLPSIGGRAGCVSVGSLRDGGRSYWSRILPPKLQRLLDTYDRRKIVVDDLLDTTRFDLTHIHGTESCWLRDAADVSCPKVVSIQGLLTDCAAGFWSRLPLRDRIFSPRLGMRWLDMRLRAKTERQFLPLYRHFFCRTRYSEHFVRKFSAAASIYFDGRILRSPFYSSEIWRARSRSGRHIMTTVSEQPYKGVHHLLPIMREPSARDLTLHIAGVRPSSEYGRILSSLSVRLGVQDRVRFLGNLPADALRLKLLQMDAYVHPATQENSPNALAEAMSLGLPCAVSRAGGSSEQIREGISGLAFDPLNIQEACGVISMISRDTSLGTRLGAAALAEARERHHPARVIEQTLSGYHRILSGDGEAFPCAHS